MVLGDPGGYGQFAGTRGYRQTVAMLPCLDESGVVASFDQWTTISVSVTSRTAFSNGRVEDAAMPMR